MVKTWIRNLMVSTGLGFTRNLTYDIQTRKILKRVFGKSESVGAMDVGCHKGEVMDLFLQFGGQGHFIGIEPIPMLAHGLQQKYANQIGVKIIEAGLSETAGITSFQWVKNAPAYSGIRKRDYDGKVPDIEEIQVQLKTLDEIWPEEKPLHLIKIDVEGGEWGVLAGGLKTLEKWKPVVIFEHGKGASEHYGTSPSMIFELLENLGLSINTMQGFLTYTQPFSLLEFCQQYEQQINYYFAAYDKHRYHR